MIDKTVILSSLAILMILYSVIVPAAQQPADEVQPTVTETDHGLGMSNYHYAYLEHTKLKVIMYSIPKKCAYVGNFEEEPSDEFNCLFYAVVPIGRYYITAYNHEETGSKMTASGKQCHEGTITTCAADPKLHKFGEYLLIGDRLYRVEDTGSAVKGQHIDVYFSSYAAMSKYGSHYETIYKVEFPFGIPQEG